MAHTATISVDAMGGECGPKVTVPAVVSFLERKDLVNLLRTQPRERKKTIRKREREKEKERVEKRERERVKREKE